MISRAALMLAMLVTAAVVAPVSSVLAVLRRGQESAGAQQHLQASGGAQATAGQGAVASAGIRVMSRSEMLAGRRAAALAPLDSITEDNAAAVLRDTAGRLKAIYESDVASPKFGASMPAADLEEFKGTVSELWSGMAGVTDADLQGVSDEEAAQVVAFVRHVARLTDDLSDPAMPHAALMQEMESVYSEGEPILSALNQ